MIHDMTSVTNNWLITNHDEPSVTKIKLWVISSHSFITGSWAHAYIPAMTSPWVPRSWCPTTRWLGRCQLRRAGPWRPWRPWLRCWLDHGRDKNHLWLVDVGWPGACLIHILKYTNIHIYTSIHYINDVLVPWLIHIISLYVYIYIYTQLKQWHVVSWQSVSDGNACEPRNPVWPPAVSCAVRYGQEPLRSTVSSWMVRVM